MNAHAGKCVTTSALGANTISPSLLPIPVAYNRFDRNVTRELGHQQPQGTPVVHFLPYVFKHDYLSIQIIR